MPVDCIAHHTPLRQMNELPNATAKALSSPAEIAADSHKHHGSIARGIYGRSRHVSSVP